jgi:hypothetical protein|tara:strand:- start:1950 stop:2165 length:216 start_codon:yes stop_codon:yes gene_type:complete
MEQLTEMSAGRRQSALRKMGERLDAKGNRVGASTTGGKAPSRVDKQGKKAYQEFCASRKRQLYFHDKPPAG